jgi:hypothetical protein
MTATATKTRKPARYVLTALPSDFGTAFRLGKADNGDGDMSEYDVLLHGRETSCTCPGHTYRNRCKHTEALEALMAAGKLSAPNSASKPEVNPQSFHAMKVGEVLHVNGHRVERVASAWKIDDCYAMSMRQVGECLMQAEPCKAPVREPGDDSVFEDL